MALSDRTKFALAAALTKGPGSPEFDEIKTILENAESDHTTLAGDHALLAAIPTTDPADGETIWNDNGVLKLASAGGG